MDANAALTGLVFIGSILVAFSTIRYDQRLSWRQKAADELLEWADESGMLASDAITHWRNWQRQPSDKPEDQPWVYAETERQLRLRYARLRRRIPSVLATEIDPYVHDLQMITNVALSQWPLMQFAKAKWMTEPPPADIIKSKPSTEAGEWLNSRVMAIVDPLNNYVARGRLPGRRIHQFKPSRLMGWDYPTDDPPVANLE